MTAPLFIFNGATGGLGRYLGETLRSTGEMARPISARLEDFAMGRTEIRAALTGKPKEVVFLQLASLVSVPLCEKEPERARHTNVDGVVATMKTFVEEANAIGARPRIVYVSSGHLYAPKESGPIREEDPLAPRSVYAKTKLEAEGALTTLSREYGADLLIARVFGLIAPGQPANYVLPGLVRRAREKNLSGVPGLDNERDYLDSRDVCRALVALGRKIQSPHAIVNVCSGEGITIRHVLELALDEIYGSQEGHSLARTVTAGASRPDDIVSIVGDPTRFHSLVGANPKQIPLNQTVRETVATLG